MAEQGDASGAGKTPELTEAGRRARRLLQRGTVPLLLTLALVGVLAVWVVDGIWRSGLHQTVVNQERAWGQRITDAEATFLVRRLQAVDAALRRMGATVERWQASPVQSDIELTPRGQTWHAEGGNESSEILVFSHRSIAKSLLAAAGGDRFDPQAKGLLLADPALEAAGLVTLAGVLRRLPASNLDDRVREREQLLNLRAVRESARQRSRGVAWYRGGSLSDRPPAQPIGAAWPVVLDGSIRAVVFVEADAARFLPEMDASLGEWTLLTDAAGTVLASDSLAEEIVGRVGTRLPNHGQRSIAEFGARLLEKPTGLLRISSRQGNWVCSYVTIQPQGWKLVLARPSGLPEGAAAGLGRSAFFGTAAMTLVLLLATWFVVRLLRRRALRQALQVDEIVDLLETSILELGRDVPLSVAGEDRYPALEALFSALRRTARDVGTARAKSERERERLATILRSLDVGVAVMDRRFNVTYTNDVIEHRHGTGLVGKRASWIVEDNPWEASETARQVLEDGQPLTVRKTIPFAGEERIYQVSYFPIHSPSGRIEGFGEVSTEVSEFARLQLEHAVLAEDLKKKNVDLQQTNVELQRADRLRTEFLANMSHELRTPMNTVLGFSRVLLRQEKDLSPRVQQNLERIEEDATRLMDLIDTMLELARLDAGDAPLHPQAFPVLDLVENVLKDYERPAEAKGVELALDAPPGEVIIRQDPDRIRQILNVLLSNALKFTDTGSVRVAIQREEEDILLTVADTGAGIPSDELAHIFERFHQADGSVTRKHGGVGLGLTLAMRLCELLKGSIHVDSAEGEGTTFTVRLPRELNEAPVA